MLRRRPATLLMLFALGVLLNGCQSAPVPHNTVLLDGEMRLLDKHPWAKRQRTYRGKAISTVEYYDGQVYLGYGDWNRNTGPIAVTSWDVSRNDWNYYYDADTEAIERFVPVSQGLIVPYVDPRLNADYAFGNLWQEDAASSSGSEAFYHVFDAAETDAGIFLIGTKNGTGEALVKHWNGQTWSDSLLLQGHQDWIWFGAVLNGNLIVESEQQGAYLFDGDAWQSTEPLFDIKRTRSVVSVGNRVAGITRHRRGGYLQISDGHNREIQPEPDALDLNKDQSSGWVYLLRRDRIERSRDLLHWEFVTGDIPPRATALDVGDGYAWIGTEDSKLWKLKLPRETNPRLMAGNPVPPGNTSP